MNIFLESDSSFYEYITLYRNERIEKQQREKAALDVSREQDYENYYYDNVNKTGTIFTLKGMQIITFTHKKIKFSFKPRKVIDLISSKVVFYCSIRHIHGRWMIMRNSLAVNIRPIVYSQCIQEKVVHLAQIVDVIFSVYDRLVKWCRSYQNFRQSKYQKYLQNPNETFLDSEDEELFLTADEVRRRREKIDEICRRMIPPPLDKRIHTSYKKRPVHI